MNGLAALLLATPLFGFSLTPPATDPALAPWANLVVGPDAGPELASLPLPMLLLEADAATSTGSTGSDEAGPIDSEEETAEADRRYTEDTRRRAELGTVHRAFGIATWGAMTITTILGFIQYYNLYGVAGTPREGTPCVTGKAWWV